MVEGKQCVCHARVNKHVQAGEFAPGDFANVCVAMTRKSSHKPVHFLKGAYPFLLHQMQRRAHKIADVVRILRVYARWPSGLMKQTTMIVAITAQLSVEALTGLADQELAQVLASLASLCGSREYPYREGIAVFHRAEPVIISRIPAMDHGSLSRIVFAYNVHGLGDGRLYRLLLDRGLEVVSAMSPRQLSNCLKVFGEQLCSRKVQRTEGWSSEHHDGKMGPSTSTTEPTWFYDAAEVTVVRKIREFKSLDVVETIVGYAHARTGSTQLWAVLVEATNHRITIFNAEQASMLCWAFAVVRTGAKLFPQLQVTALERLNQFSAFGLTNMLWAFAVMKKLDPDFCEPILAVLTPEVVSSDSRCALLFPTLRELQAVHPDFDPAGTERYLGYCRSHFWDLQLSTAPSDELMTSISDTLVQIERPGVGMYDFDGFLVDVWVPGIKAAILVSTRANMQARSQTPTGEAILRHRHVMRGTRGRVIHVWDQEWYEMDSQERATFLRERLDRWYEEDQNVEKGQGAPEGSTESVPTPKRIPVEPIPGEVELLKKLQERMKEEVEIGSALTPGLCAGSPQEMARNIRRQRRAAKRWKEIDTPEDEPARLPWEAKMWVKERKTRHGGARGSK
ncbi:hypothetical protein Pmar_PMAR018560 [Perkinsus marinus ATCC 50983]|uniref:RAP domain-containing protein n=1 Tax=Perkinsus marinus (strain ATCC 50983 / TXsc) TaxID=423536 RepID=C5L058_PERM5|nr:hypothetical protein Pmar_PMAR018560 [Perkinsus marinus ATCC 50983]EER09916.1 hypothetical protein Pmar_PMAR018560 [Perkinsus marinus ATCC 50983]|eukprot:XP_002778121.1 hypothetical protein Pmar_PMAR018560 [Perkinsus marinus ATCC 50983]